MARFSPVLSCLCCPFPLRRSALMVSTASRVGTGNIVGVANAIAIGGYGSVFWMWIVAIFGMMTNYSENVLGIFYRRKNLRWKN